MNNLIWLFIMKLLDTAIGALKNVFMIKGKHFLSALSNSVSYLFYILLMKQLMSDTSIPSVIVTLVAVFLGQYLAQYMADKFEKDKVWKISITPETKKISKLLADELRERNIPVQTCVCYNSHLEEVLNIIAFAETREETLVVQEIIKNYKVKFNIVEIRNRF